MLFKNENLTQTSIINIMVDKSCETMQNLVKLDVLKEQNGSFKTFTELKDGAVCNTIYLFIDESSPCDDIKKSFAKAIKEMNKIAKSYTVNLGTSTTKIYGLFAEVEKLVNYKFAGYKTGEKAPEIKIYIENVNEEQLSAVEMGENLGENVNLARDLGNTPAEFLTPQKFVEIGMQKAQKLGFKAWAIEEDELVKMGAGALLTVGKASRNRPVMLMLEYSGDQTTTDYVGIAGKGITFDSGGYCLKPGAGMYGMKTDMCGAAATMGAVCAIAQNKIKANVIAAIPLCENLIGKDAALPGDVITSLNGKTIEIGNTDAEGRLVLADALHYLTTMEKVTEVLDIATLTGANANAFGGICSAVMSNCDETYAKLEVAGTATGDKVWRLPLFDEYKEFTKSQIADLKNVSEARVAGGILGGIFLEEFVNGKKWAHIDIAGAANAKKEGAYHPIGCTGFGTRLMYNFVQGK